MAEHHLKCWPEPFAAIIDGSKTAEFRRDDREFEVGDVLLLMEWYPALEHFTARQARKTVTHISRGPDWGIPDGFVVMSLAPGGVFISADRHKPIPEVARDDQARVRLTPAGRAALYRALQVELEVSHAG